MSTGPGALVIVANPISGSGRAKSLVEGLPSAGGLWKDFLRIAGVSPGREKDSVLWTDAQGKWKDQLRALIEAGGLGAIVAVGGDGTLSEVAATIHAHRGGQGAPAVLFLPGGRGNDFLRGIYGAEAPANGFWDWLASKFTGWRARPIDLATVDGRVFLNMASVGYGGEIVKNVHSRKALWSSWASVYQIEGAISLLSPKISRCQIKVEGREAFSGELFGAFVGNGKANGAGLFWCPAADPCDGRLDFLAFPRPTLFGMSESLAASKRKAEPVFKHTRGTGGSVIFHFDRTVALELDGEYVGSSISYEFTSLPSALAAFLPSTTA